MKKEENQMKKEENQKKHKVSFCFLILTLIVLMLPPGSPAAPNKIVFGQAIGISGPFASVAAFSEIPIIKLWLEEVNKEGGIYVPEYGKRLPVELLRYDDKGDIPTTLKLFEKLATVDKVDIILPPCATPYGLAVAPLAAKYKYPLVTFTLMTERYREKANQYGYTFITINCPAETQAALRDLMVELGVKKAAIIYVAQEMGIENAQALEPLMKPAGIEVAMFKNYPVLPKDLSPLLKEAKTAAVDAFIAHSSPPDTMLLPEQAKMINFNPKLFYTSVATAWSAFKDKFGAATDGIMGPGGWNEKLSPKAKEFHDKFLAMHGRPADNWSSATGYACLQVYKQAIEKVGLKDRQKLRDVIATETFDTAYGPVKFVNYFNTSHPSLIGQWQKGVFEPIAPKGPGKPKPIYPKPLWPK